MFLRHLAMAHARPQVPSRGAVSAERKPEYIAALGEKHALA